MSTVAQCSMPISNLGEMLCPGVCVEIIEEGQAAEETTLPSGRTMEQTNNIEALHQMNPEEYPVLYKALYSYKGALLHRLEQLIEYRREHGKSWVFASVGYLVGRYGGSCTTWQTNREYLSAVGLMNIRKPTKKTTSRPLQDSIQRAGKGRQAVIWYTIPDYTPERLARAERTAARFKAKGINRKGLTKQGLIIAVGPKEANKAVIDGRSRSERDRAAEYEIVRQIQMAISRKGYAMKEQVIKRSTKRIKTAFKLDYIEALCLIRHIWANRNKRLLSMAGARYHRPTRAEKERLNLKDNGWIITVEGEVF